MKDKMTYVIVSSFIKGVGSILDGGSLYDNKAIKKIILFPILWQVTMKED